MGSCASLYTSQLSSRNTISVNHDITSLNELKHAHWVDKSYEATKQLNSEQDGPRALRTDEDG
jgi:hypothetical protein